MSWFFSKYPFNVCNCHGTSNASGVMMEVMVWGALDFVICDSIFVYISTVFGAHVACEMMSLYSIIINSFRSQLVRACFISCSRYFMS